MWKAFVRWWNTPAENLMTKGHNLLFLLGFVLPLALLLLGSLLKAFGVLPLSWRMVVSPLALLLLLPLMALSPTGRDVVMGRGSTKDND